MEPSTTDAIGLVEHVTQSGGFENLAQPLQVALFMGGLSLLSIALVCLTAFTRIVIVLSFVRRALTTQEIPPTPVLIGLAMFMTLFVMGPTIDAINSRAIQPYLSDQISGSDAVRASSNELHGFLLGHTRRQDLALFIHMSRTEPPQTAEETPMRILIPAFMISELKTAFIMGFGLYIPFLLIDLVVSTVLMSLGMMMMPPVVISTPFKILLFVLVDGWHLIARALGASFG